MRVDSSEYCFVFIAVTSDRNKENYTSYYKKTLTHLGKCQLKQ